MSTEEIPDDLASECCYSLCCNSSKPKTPWQKMMRVQLIFFPIVIMSFFFEALADALQPSFDVTLRYIYCICEIIMCIIGFISLFIFKKDLLSTVKYGNITLSIATIPLIYISFQLFYYNGDGYQINQIVVLIYTVVFCLINLFLFFMSTILLRSESYLRKCGIFQDVDQSNLLGNDRNTDTQQIYHYINTSHVEDANNDGIYSRQYRRPVHNNYYYPPNIPQPSNFAQLSNFNGPILPDIYTGRLYTSNDVPVDQIYVNSNQDHNTTTDN